LATPVIVDLRHPSTVPWAQMREALRTDADAPLPAA
jgi:hypothetical protein